MPKIVARTPKESDPHWCRKLISKEVQVTDMAKGEWMVREHLAEGGYAHVHTVSKGSCPNKLRNRSKYVIKSESCDEKKGTLSAETEFFKDVCTSKPINGLPPYVASGVYESPSGSSFNRNFLIMPKYDSDLFNFRMRSGGKFDTKLATSFAMKTLDVLEQIHKNGYLHRDVKENNILINFPNKLRSDFELVICDFGLAQPIVTKKIGSMSPAQGTAEYAGLDAHKSKYGRVGDLISLCFCVIEWLGGSLPWMKLTGVITWERIFPKKEKFMKDLGKIARSVKTAEGVSIIKKCLRYLHTLEYDAIPDYGKCRSMFNEILQQNVVPTQPNAGSTTGDNNIIQKDHVAKRQNRKTAFAPAKDVPGNQGHSLVERKRCRIHIPNARTRTLTVTGCIPFAETQGNSVAGSSRQLAMVEFQQNETAGCIQQQVQVEPMPSKSGMALRSMTKKNSLLAQNVVPTQSNARTMTGDNNKIQEAQIPQRSNQKRAVEHAKKLPDNQLDAPVERKRCRRHIPNAGTHKNTAAECSRFAQTQATPIAGRGRQFAMVEFQPNESAGCIQQQVQVEPMPSTSRMTLRSMAKKLQNQEPRTVPYNLRSRREHINVPATTTTSNKPHVGMGAMTSNFKEYCGSVNSLEPQKRSNKNRSPVLQPPELNTRSVPKRPRKPNNAAPQNRIASPSAGGVGIRTDSQIQQQSQIIGVKNERIRAIERTGLRRPF